MPISPASHAAKSGLILDPMRAAQSWPERPKVHPFPDRLTALRAELARQGVDGCLVPRADEHLGEYVPPSAERLAWLTGFTGSAGLAVVLPDRAALFTDGRYVTQAQRADRPRALAGPARHRGAAARLDQGSRAGGPDRLRPLADRRGGAGPLH